MYRREIFPSSFPKKMCRVFRGNVAYAVEIAAMYTDDTEQAQMLKAFCEGREVLEGDFYHLHRLHRKENKHQL